MMQARRVAIATPLLMFAMALSPLAADAQVPEGDGYLFGVPRGSLSFRFGYARPSANSDVFRFTSQHLTLDRGDFGGFTFAGDAGIFLKPRLEVTFGVGISSRRAESNYRDFVDFQSLDVFDAELESYAWSPAGYGAVGLQYSVSTKAALVTELRYDAVKRAPMSFAFQGFDNIDLSGTSVTAGVHLRF